MNSSDESDERIAAGETRDLWNGIAIDNEESFAIDNENSLTIGGR